MIILASQSPTRRALLTAAGLEFKAILPPFDEDEVKQTQPVTDPKTLASSLAAAKSKAAARDFTSHFVVGADQTLEFQGQCLHKTRTLADAREQLILLRGNTHQLHSAVVITRGEKTVFDYVATAQLTMRQFSDSFLDHYLETVDPGIAKSLGGYQLEGMGIQLFERIDGDYFTILGLPLLPMLAFFREHGEIDT